MTGRKRFTCDEYDEPGYAGCSGYGGSLLFPGGCGAELFWRSDMEMLMLMSAQGTELK